MNDWLQNVELNKEATKEPKAVQTLHEELAERQRAVSPADHAGQEVAERPRTAPAVREVSHAENAGKESVLVEWVPGNARRIYATVDIPASLEEVWQVMTDYANLPVAIPNLKVCDVLEYFPEDGGASMWQVGTANFRVPGTSASLSFEAGATLRVSLHPSGVPEGWLQRAGGSLVWGGDADPLVRGVFPQPPEEMTAGRQGPVREITMQNVAGAKGDFRHYQGLWRLESAPPSPSRHGPITRLSYASEVAPHWFLPVAPVEGQIASALGENLDSIRDFVVGRSAGERH